MGIPFPATFVRMSLLKKYNFDTGYTIAGDFDFAGKHITKSNLMRIPVVVSYMERGGVSEDMKNPQLLDERIRILYKVVHPRAKEFLSGCLNNIKTEDYSLEE